MDGRADVGPAGCDFPASADLGVGASGALFAEAVTCAAAERGLAASPASAQTQNKNIATRIMQCEDRVEGESSTARKRRIGLPRSISVAGARTGPV